MTFTKGLTSAEIRATPLSVTFTNNALAVTGPLTNTELRATPIPISGSVSVTGNVNVTNGLDVDVLTLPAITGAVSVTNFPASQAVTGTFFPPTQPVSIASMPSTPVTGTFWQATQPVSGPLTDVQLRAAALPVSGTFFQPTQPVSLTALPLPAGAATEATLAALNTKMPALGQGAMAASQPVVIASNQSSIPTKDATDVGRVTRHFLFNTPTAAPAAEALQSVTQWYNNAPVATTTQPAVVPAGKTFRIMGARVNTASLAAAGMVMLRIRANTAGLVVIGSPLVASLQCGSQAAVAALQDTQFITFPEGIDLPAGTGIGFTLQGYVGATGTLQSFTTFEVWGYEYTT